jgi:hypothetical protein
MNRPKGYEVVNPELLTERLWLFLCENCGNFLEQCDGCMSRDFAGEVVEFLRGGTVDSVESPGVAIVNSRAVQGGNFTPSRGQGEIVSEHYQSVWMEYRKSHQACPLCNSQDICHTDFGYAKPPDLNRAHCARCGWNGTVDDLIAFKEAKNDE